MRLPVVHHGVNGRFAVRDGDWKLAMPHEGSSYELYNLLLNPSETNNVYAANKTIAADLQAALTDIVIRGRPTPGTDVKNDTEWWNDLTWISSQEYGQ